MLVHLQPPPPPGRGLLGTSPRESLGPEQKLQRGKDSERRAEPQALPVNRPQTTVLFGTQ